VATDSASRRNWRRARSWTASAGGQDVQGDQRQRAGHREQRGRYLPGGARDVGLYGSRVRAGRHAGQGQRDDLDAGQRAAQQIDRLADTALEPILDLDLAWLR
jgi:hypothetical protein